MGLSYAEFTLLAGLLVATYPHSQGALPDVLQTCCDVGTTWFTLSRERCSVRQGPFEGVDAADTASCQAVVEVCCLKAKSRKQCQQGKQIARIRRSCDALHSQLGNWHSRECCSCCQLGRAAQRSGVTCSLLDTDATYSPACKATFEECCIGDQDPTTTAPPPPTDPPGLELLNECKRFSGQLCAHLCIDTPTSYRCACHTGFTLQPDGRTCKQDVMDRCQMNNPCQHLCVDTGVAINCKCLQGFILKPDGRTCEDEDECKIGTHTCQPGQKCINTPGAFACEGISKPSPTSCHQGYVYNAVTNSCEDLDECRLSPTLCATTEMCSNTPGSYRCVALTPNDPNACGSGFTLNPTTNNCEDIDECLTGRHNCHGNRQICRNLIGSHACMCERGFRYDPRAQQCEDINECALNQDSCLEGQGCENTVGSYNCRRSISCGTGYTLDRATQLCTDTDECLTGRHNCHGNHQICHNLNGSYTCMCEHGFGYNPRTHQCEDDNECTLGTHNCGLARECQNTQGSFRCVQKECPRGHRLDFSTGMCQAVVCARGLRADRAGNCIDINECVDNPSPCRPMQECFNTIGSYSCRNILSCGHGYELNERGNKCLDVDECERGTHDCNGPHEECINRRGTFMCRCLEGYRRNHGAQSCEDIDECSRYGGQVCAQNARCENSPGSFTCVCNEGFESEGGRGTCRDVDECTTLAGACQHSCRNTWGSFQCTCRDGYRLTADKRTCEDIDECEQWADRGGLCIGECENTPGSYLCSCPGGYSMMGDGRTCIDIDECSLRTANCHGVDSLCINTRGGYKCETTTCPKGFVRAPSLGSSKNNVRCQRQTFVCAQGDTECLYAPLSYSMNFITFPSQIQVPADLFNMRGSYSPYRRLEFDLKLVSSADPVTGEARVTQSFFNVRREGTNEAVVQLMQRIEGPQDIELELHMNIYSKEFRERGAERFFGTAVAKIKIYVTADIWH